MSSSASSRGPRRKIGRPVKYTATRSEAFLTDYQGRDLATTVELALTKDGRFLALRADNVSNVGARCVSLSPLGKGAGLITGSYDIPAATLRARAVFTNTMPTNAYRSSGRPEVNFAIERVIEQGGARLGLRSASTLRRAQSRRAPTRCPTPTRSARNTTAAPTNPTSTSPCASRTGHGFAARKQAAAARGRLLGHSVTPYVESSIGNPRERTDIKVRADGRVDVVIGTQPSGQGHETSFAQVAADLMGLPFDTVQNRDRRHRHRVGRRRLALRPLDAACRDRAVGRRAAARRQGQGRSRRRSSSGGPTRSSGPAAVCPRRTATSPSTCSSWPQEADARGLAAARGQRTDNEMHEPVFPNGCAVCEVEVDPETGWVDITRYAAVDDVGRCINPLIVHGQTHGGIAQGVGQAMWELCHIDPASGQPLMGSLMDYGMPRADNLPSFETEIVEVLSPTNPLGIKAGGEGGTTPALSAIVNAILDATWDARRARHRRCRRRPPRSGRRSATQRLAGGVAGSSRAGLAPDAPT